MLPAQLQINPASIWRRGFLLLVFSMAFIACILLKSLLGFALLAILCLILWFYWQKKELVISLGVQESGEVEVCFRQGQTELMRLLPSSVVTDVLIVLHLQNAQRRLALVLWPDSAPSEVLRQWRVYLRWGWSDPARADEAED